MKNFILIPLLITLLLLTSLASISLTVIAQPVNEQLLADLKAFDDQAVVLDKDKITHLVFIDVWRSYEGKGDEKMIAALPKQFLQQSQQVWLQPEVNVTKAHLAEFQQYFPTVTPLILDQQFLLMRALKVWQSPYHVLIKANKTLFSGDEAGLLTYINKNYALDIKSHKEPPALATQQNSKILAINTNKTRQSVTPTKPNKPMPGDNAPQFSAQTLTGEQITLVDVLVKLKGNKPLNLVFLDALCPMPHFPACEAKLAQLNELMAADSNNQWLGVVNSYYVNKEYVQQFSDRFKLKLPLLFDQDNTIYRAYDVYASPYLIKINQLGLIESRGDVLY